MDSLSTSERFPTDTSTEEIQPAATEENQFEHRDKTLLLEQICETSDYKDFDAGIKTNEFPIESSSIFHKCTSLD